MLTSIKPISLNSLQGKFIIAHPNMPDNRFAKTIVYITEHNSNGAEGVVINKTSAYTFVNLVNSLNNFKIDQALVPEQVKEIKILRGGPVNNDKIFILHSADYKNSSDTTTLVDDKVAYTKSVDVLEAVINGIGPKQISIFIGNCSWTAMQLDLEIQNDTWILCEEQNNYIFNPNFDKLWENMYHSLGITNTSSSYFYVTEKTLQ